MADQEQHEQVDSESQEDDASGHRFPRANDDEDDASGHRFPR